MQSATPVSARVMAEMKQNVEDLEKLKTFQKEYVDLKKTILDLPKKLHHKMLVPLSPVGFMPGHIVHSNELTVLLGDGQFAEKTASESAEVIDRRLEYLADEIKKKNEDIYSAREKLNLSAELKSQLHAEIGEQPYEITEEYDSDEEREAAKKRVFKSEFVEDPEMDERIMKRLEELEALEAEAEARGELSSDEEGAKMDYLESLRMDADSDDGTDGEETPRVPPRLCSAPGCSNSGSLRCPCQAAWYCNKSCQRRHWKVHKAGCAWNNGAATRKPAEPKPTGKVSFSSTPAHAVTDPQPQSTPGKAEPASQSSQRTFNPGSSAFTGMVKEREVAAPAGGAEESTQPKKVSRFMQMRKGL